jgi:hypothetical protein
MRDYAALGSMLLVDLPNAVPPFNTSDMEISDVRASSLASSFLKKLEDTTSSAADDACLALFTKCNVDCASFKLEAKKLFHDEVIGEVKHILDDLFFNGPDLCTSLSEIEGGFGVGPGASLGARSYNFYSKLFDSPLTYTSDQLPLLYTRALTCNPTWASAEKQRGQEFGFRKVEGNRLSFVPKTSTISRSICTEPSLNMLFQKGLGTVFERMLKQRFRIDLTRQQELNRKLAKLGSSNGAFGTIDLKSASDCISLELCRQILPPYVMRWVEMFRSPSVVYPDGSVHELYMVSSMGNGFTFPLQTLIFVTIVLACYRVLGIKPLYLNGCPKNFGVNGDDIIVRSDAYDFVVDCLGLFGFTVNLSKSFNVGWFRESCGGDYWRGADVRGVYIKSLKHETDVYSAINRLVRWCANSGILLPTVLSALCGMVRFLPVPSHAGDTEGVKVPFKHLKRVLRDETGCVFYNALTAVPISFKAPTGDSERTQRYPGKKKQLIGFNMQGLVVSFVGGYIRNDRITLRDEDHAEVRRYKVRRRKTPHWDYIPSAGLKDQVRDWEVTYDLLAEFCLRYAGT